MGKIQVGARVRLKSGGPTMIVVGQTFEGSIAGDVVCQWKGEDGSDTRGPFPEESLEELLIDVLIRGSTFDNAAKDEPPKDEPEPEPRTTPWTPEENKSVLLDETGVTPDNHLLAVVRQTIAQAVAAHKVGELHAQLSHHYPEMYLGPTPADSLWGIFPWLRNVSASIQARVVALVEQRRLAVWARDPLIVEQLRAGFIETGTMDAVTFASKRSERCYRAAITDIGIAISGLTSLRERLAELHGADYNTEVALAGGAEPAESRKDPEEETP